MSIQSFLEFWCQNVQSWQWWRSNFNVNRTSNAHFSPLHVQAGLRMMVSWRATLRENFAEIIVPDRFSRDQCCNANQTYENGALAQNAQDMESRQPSEIRRRDVIRRFDRFPRRNEVLGHSSSTAEPGFLLHPNFSF